MIFIQALDPKVIELCVAYGLNEVFAINIQTHDYGIRIHFYTSGLTHLRIDDAIQIMNAINIAIEIANDFDSYFIKYKKKRLHMTKEPKPLPLIRWIAGNLQIGNHIIPWQQCAVDLDASFEFADGEIAFHGVLLKFTHPNLVPEIFPDPEQPEEWVWFLEGELAEAVREFLIKDGA